MPDKDTVVSLVLSVAFVGNIISVAQSRVFAAVLSQRIENIFWTEMPWPKGCLSVGLFNWFSNKTLDKAAKNQGAKDGTKKEERQKQGEGHVGSLMHRLHKEDVHI